MVENQCETTDYCPIILDDNPGIEPLFKKVRIDIESLAVRVAPGIMSKRTGEYVSVGEYEIEEVMPGEGSKLGWGKLKSGEGWISLDYAEEI